MEANNDNLYKIILSSLAIVLNIVGGFLALILRLPIYIDSIGTIFSAILFGPFYGSIVGIFTNIINGITFDPVSIYYIPVQFAIGLLTGLLIKNFNFFNVKILLKILLITVLTSIISSIITTFVFGGITSSGSSYLISALRLTGLNIFYSVFSVQFITDLIDRYISFFIAYLLIKLIPKKYKVNFKRK